MTGARKNGPSVTDFLDSLVIKDLWKTPDGESWATIETNSGIENVAIIAKHGRLRQWLTSKYKQITGNAPYNDFISRAVALLDSDAAFSNGVHIPHYRSAGNIRDGIFIDLGSESWECIWLTKDGWEICKQSSFRFYRNSSMRALPIPIRTGSIDTLRSMLNCENEEDWILILTWIVSSICRICPFPILVLTGGPGSTKSTTAKLIKMLIDPSEVMTTRCPKDQSDFTSSVSNSYVLSFDNISGIPPWLSDELCMVASGSGIRERKLHSNDGEKVITGGRPVILNGIGDIATRSDIVDRSVIVKLDTPATRRAEKLQTNEGLGFWDEFDALIPEILGSLCDIICKTMMIHSLGQDIPAGNPRMLDFALLGNAVEVVMGWEKGTFDKAYAGNREQADEIALENSPIISLLNNTFAHQSTEWIGTITELKEKLLDKGGAKYAIDNLEKMSVGELGKNLSALSKNLNAQGWNTQQLMRSGKKGRRWSIKSPS